MIDLDALAELRRAFTTPEGWLRPAYGARSIAEIPPTIEALLRLTPSSACLPRPLWAPYAGASRVVLLLVDGLSLEHLSTLGPGQPFFSALLDASEVHPLTSVFPSSTAPALTTLQTGLTPAAHGLLEWTVYFEEFGRVINTLPFRGSGTRELNSLLRAGGTPEMLYDGETVYQRLSRAGVKTHVLSFAGHAGSAYSIATHRGATWVPYADARDLARRLGTVLAETPAPSYTYVYWGAIDSTMHEHGPGSRQHLEAMRLFGEALQAELLATIHPRIAAETVLMVSADHGHVPLGQPVPLDPLLPDLEPLLRRAPGGARIPVTGSPRNVFLLLEPGTVERAARLLGRALEGRAEVLRVGEAVGRGLFGQGMPGDRFSRRAGDLLIVPRPGYSIWYEEGPEPYLEQAGVHGGLSLEEMEVPLAITTLDRLRARACPAF